MSSAEPYQVLIKFKLKSVYGLHYPKTDEHKEKLRQVRKLQPSPNLGRTFGLEARNNMRLGQLEREYINQYADGTPIPDEIKDKISISVKKMWEDKIANGYVSPLLGRQQNTVECLNCNKQISVTWIKRHSNKCK